MSRRMARTKLRKLKAEYSDKLPDAAIKAFESKSFHTWRSKFVLVMRMHSMVYGVANVSSRVFSFANPTRTRRVTIEGACAKNIIG